MPDALPLDGRRVAVHIGGSVAAYRSCDVVTGLRKLGAEVRVAMTDGAQHFITPTTLRALSGHAVATSVWEASVDVAGDGMAHIALSAWAEVHVVVAASASLIARLAVGMADDAVTAIVLASRAPLVICPAMETAMWEHPATLSNVLTLTERGAEIIGPDSGRLASGHIGVGRMAEVATIVRAAEAALTPAVRWLDGRRVVVTAGGTREPIDPVRFLGNRSSGRMGEALAAEAARLGATVTIITTTDAPSNGVRRVRVETAEEMRSAVESAVGGSDVLVMAAAVADERPATRTDHKLKKDGSEQLATLRLEPTVDILADLHERGLPPALRVIGFAAETEDVIANAEGKLRLKKLDAVVANQVGVGGAMGGFDAEVTVITSDGTRTTVPRAPKPEVARRVWDALRPVIDRD